MNEWSVTYRRRVGHAPPHGVSHLVGYPIRWRVPPTETVCAGQTRPRTPNNPPSTWTRPTLWVHWGHHLVWRGIHHPIHLVVDWLCLFRYNSLWVQQSLHEIIESVFAPEWKMLMALQFIHECQKSQEAFGGFGTSAGHSHTFSSLRRNDIACGGEKLSQYLRFTVSGFIYVGNGIRTLTEKTTQPPTNNYYSQS